jgi:phage recombination protein Bet
MRRFGRITRLELWQRPVVEDGDVPSQVIRDQVQHLREAYELACGWRARLRLKIELENRMNDLARAEKSELSKIVVTAEQMEVVKNTLAKDATPAELQLFFYDCQRQGVHPLDRLLHFTKRGGKYTPVTSIDLFRARAADTGCHAGTSDAEFGPLDVDGHPEFARVVVSKLLQGQVIAFAATARWAEYYPGDQAGMMWKKMPHLMLSKVAEALAIRKAFPRELAGVYTNEEMAQAGPVPQPIQQPKRAGQSVAAGAAAPITQRTSAQPLKNAAPAPTAPTPAPTQTQAPADDLSIDEEVIPAGLPEMPSGPELDGAETVMGVLEEVTAKGGKKKNGTTFVRFGLCVEKQWYGTFDKKIGEYANTIKGRAVTIWFTRDGDFQNLVRVQPNEA